MIQKPTKTVLPLMLGVAGLMLIKLLTVWPILASILFVIFLVISVTVTVGINIVRHLEILVLILLTVGKKVDTRMKIASLERVLATVLIVMVMEGVWTEFVDVTMVGLEQTAKLHKILSVWYKHYVKQVQMVKIET